VVAVFATACHTIGVAQDLVTAFGGSVSTLGTAATYVNHAALLLGWLLATAALVLGHRASRELGATRAARVGLLAAALGTFLLAASEALSVWVTSITLDSCTSCGILSGRMTTTFTPFVHHLTDTGLVLVALGWLVLAVGAFVARPTNEATVAARHWRRALLMLGIALALGAVGPLVEFVLLLSSRSWNSGQVEALSETVPPTLSWLALAIAIGLIGGALRRSPRTSRLASAAALGVLGACLLAAAAVTQHLIVDEIELAGTHASWLVNLTKIGAASAWCGWLSMTVAFGLAAGRLASRDLVVVPFARLHAPR